MSKWETKKLPTAGIDVIVKRRFEDGTTDVRIGYLRHPAGVKTEWHFVVPKYECEVGEIKKWEIVAWQELPE